MRANLSWREDTKRMMYVDLKVYDEMTTCYETLAPSKFFEVQIFYINSLVWF